MPSPDSNQPSLAYSSSSSSITSQLSSSPQYAHADDDTDTVESNTYSSWGAGKHGIRHFVVAYCICFGLSSALLITALTNVESPFCNLSDYDPDSISASPIDSKSKFGDMPSKSHHRGKSIGANVKAADVSTVLAESCSHCIHRALTNKALSRLLCIHDTKQSWQRPINPSNQSMLPLHKD